MLRGLLPTCLGSLDSFQNARQPDVRSCVYYREHAAGVEGRGGGSGAGTGRPSVFLLRGTGWACIRCRGGREGSCISAPYPCFLLTLPGLELGGRCWCRSDRHPVRAQAAQTAFQSLPQHLGQLKLPRKWPWWGGECAPRPQTRAPGLRKGWPPLRQVGAAPLDRVVGGS